jgi:kumamolisin
MGIQIADCLIRRLRDDARSNNRDAVSESPHFDEAARAAKGFTMANNTHVVLSGSERVPMPGAHALGAASEHEWVEVTVKLRRKQALPDLDGRPKPISQAELIKTYGGTQGDVDAVKAALEPYGLKLIDADASTRSVRFGGPVSAMEQAFEVKLVRYAHERGEYRGRRGALQIPKQLAGIVEGVFGLDNRPVVKKRLRAMPKGSLATAGKTHRSWYFPAELAQFYNFPTGDGTGQVIGLLEFGGGYFESDLAAFCNAAKISMPAVVPISVDGAATDQHDGAEGEVMLDIEVVAGVCPNARIPVYFSSFTEKGWIDVLDAAIHDNVNQPSVLSISWGDAEDNASWTVQAINQVNEALKEAAMLGITVCVAAGDDGSDDQVGDGHAHVDFPSSSPYVLGVGGTIIQSKKNEKVEATWKDGDGLRKDGGGSTGGGVSVIFTPPPVWQTVTVPSVNPGAQAGRCVPDVAADASVHSGYFMVVDG